MHLIFPFHCCSHKMCFVLKKIVLCKLPLRHHSCGNPRMLREIKQQQSKMVIEMSHIFYSTLKSMDKRSSVYLKCISTKSVQFRVLCSKLRKMLKPNSLKWSGVCVASDVAAYVEHSKLCSKKEEYQVWSYFRVKFYG